MDPTSRGQSSFRSQQPAIHPSSVNKNADSSLLAPKTQEDNTITIDPKVANYIRRLEEKVDYLTKDNTSLEKWIADLMVVNTAHVQEIRDTKAAHEDAKRVAVDKERKIEDKVVVGRSLRQRPNKRSKWDF